MSATVPTTEPTRFSAGDTLRFTRALSDYPASEWSLNYNGRNAAYAFSFAGVSDGNLHSVTVAATATASWPTGEYQLYGFVTGSPSGDPEQHSVYSGLLTILPNKASTQPLEFRSWAQQALAAIELAIITDAGRGGILEYSINGRSFRYSFDQAIKMRDYLLGQVAIEQGRGSQRKILTRFRSPRGSYMGPFV